MSEEIMDNQIKVDKDFLLKLSKKIDDNFDFLNKKINFQNPPKSISYKVETIQADVAQIQQFSDEIRPLLDKYGIQTAVITKV